MNSEKTTVFWIGLILLSAASVFLFGVLWIVAAVFHPNFRREIVRSPLIPAIVGGVVFIFIGIYMMRSGVSERTVEE